MTVESTRHNINATTEDRVDNQTAFNVSMTDAHRSFTSVKKGQKGCDQFVRVENVGKHDFFITLIWYNVHEMHRNRKQVAERTRAMEKFEHE